MAEQTDAGSSSFLFFLISNVVTSPGSGLLPTECNARRRKTGGRTGKTPNGPPKAEPPPAPNPPLPPFFHQGCFQRQQEPVCRTEATSSITARHSNQKPDETSLGAIFAVVHVVVSVLARPNKDVLTFTHVLLVRTLRNEALVGDAKADTPAPPRHGPFRFLQCSYRLCPPGGGVSTHSSLHPCRWLPSPPPQP